MVNSNERSDMVEWLNKWLSGRDMPVDSRLEIIGAEEQVVEEVQYRDVVPVSYHPPAVYAREDDTQLYESLTFKARIIEAN